MDLREGLFLAVSIVGGVALFMVGMSILTDGLRLAAGERVRSILFGATRSRVAAVGFGAWVGALAHSTAASVMVVGFVNAGLMTLRGAIAVLMGAGIGTTLAMQLISFQLSQYAFVGIAVGFVCRAVIPESPAKHLGTALLGFGLLFLGLDFLSEAVGPYREQLAPWLERIDGGTFGGMLAGIGVAAAVTAILQSSGATIGMLFALAEAGIVTDLYQILPIVLGAHIGTVGTAAMVSIGANIEARRAALGYLLFQLFNVALAVVAAPLLLKLVAMIGGDLARQTANVHTLVRVVAVAALLPFLPWFVTLVRRLMPTRGATVPISYLDPRFLRMPEKAMHATLQELGRIAAVCLESFDHACTFFAQGGSAFARKVRLNEEIVDEVRVAVKDYLAKLALGSLSRRQALMVQYLNHCMSDIERIGDHISKLVELRRLQAKEPEAAFDKETSEELRELLKEAEEVLTVMSKGFAPEQEDFGMAGRELLEVRNDYDERSHRSKAAVNGRVSEHDLHPLVGLYFSEYAAGLDRIVKHCKMIGRELQQPFFRIKESKLDRVAD